MSDIQSDLEAHIGSIESIGLPPKKKGNKIWIFGGIGCLLVCLLCAGGIGILGYKAYAPIKEAMVSISAAEAQIQSSAEVQAELGTPVVVFRISIENGDQSMIVGGEVSGTKGSGTYEVEVMGDATDGNITFKTKSITVEANGKTIEVADDLGDLESELDGLDGLDGLE